jgi:hypothetical protein
VPQPLPPTPTPDDDNELHVPVDPELFSYTPLPSVDFAPQDTQDTQSTQIEEVGDEVILVQEEMRVGPSKAYQYPLQPVAVVGRMVDHAEAVGG